MTRRGLALALLVAAGCGIDDGDIVGECSTCGPGGLQRAMFMYNTANCFASNGTVAHYSYGSRSYAVLGPDFGTVRYVSVDRKLDDSFWIDPAGNGIVADDESLAFFDAHGLRWRVDAVLDSGA